MKHFLLYFPQNHEFTDELTFSEMCMTESVGYRTSRSTSISSQQGVSTSCCPRRAKRRACASPTPRCPSAGAAYRSWTLCKCTIPLLDTKGTASHRPWWFIHIKKRKSIIRANMNVCINTIWKKVCITEIEHRN